MSNTYEAALRDCLLDCKAILEAVQGGKLRFEHVGQVRALIRDIGSLRNRENCPNYTYHKVMDSQTIRDEDGNNLFRVVNALAFICYDKSNHILLHYQDTLLAKRWERAGRAMEKAAANRDVESLL